MTAHHRIIEVVEGWRPEHGFVERAEGPVAQRIGSQRIPRHLMQRFCLALGMVGEMRIESAYASLQSPMLIERRERAKKLFGCEYVNVQPHSGAQANGAVLLAFLKPGDTMMGMSLVAGGHLTHGSKAALSGKWFNSVQYGVRQEDALIDFDEVERLAREHHPKLIIAGGSAYPRAIDFKKFREIADEVGALFMVDMAHFAGLVAT